MKIGIDLGTTSVVVALENRGVILREASVLALDKKSDKILYIGEKAREMLGKTGNDITAIYPLKDGVIADYDATVIILKYYLNKVYGKIRLFKPDIVLNIPAKITSIEERALKEAALTAGAGEVYLVPSPIAGALGAGLSIKDPVGNMVVDIGSGTTDIAIISMGDIVFGDSLRIGGYKIDESIIRYVRKVYNLIIGEQTAEEIKIKIGSAVQTDSSLSLEVKGRDLIDGVPKTITLTDEEVRGPIDEFIKTAINGIKRIFEKTPPELIADIIDNGVMLIGGGSLLRGLEERLNREFGICFHIAQDSIDCVARGTIMVK